MRIEYLGDGPPAVAIIGGTHGDEPCGPAALEHLRSRVEDLDGCVLAIHANERAGARGERAVDTDLNRAYPGDPEAAAYEAKLAATIRAVTESVPVYDLHSTRIPTPSGEPFGIFAERRETVVEQVNRSGVERALHFEFDDGSGLHHLPSVEIEHTPKGSEDAREQAERTVERILAAHDLLPGTAAESEPLVYGVYDTVEKDGDWTITATNWQAVEEGDVIARTPDGPKRASEPFVPVLFSPDYDDILGYKARAPVSLQEFTTGADDGDD